MNISIIDNTLRGEVCGLKNLIDVVGRCNRAMRNAHAAKRAKLCGLLLHTVLSDVSDFASCEFAICFHGICWLVCLRFVVWLRFGVLFGELKKGSATRWSPAKICVCVSRTRNREEGRPLGNPRGGPAQGVARRHIYILA